MKPSSSALITYLNNARANPDVPLLMADAFTFTLRDGLVLCYTNVDATFTYNGNTYLANSIRVDGLKYKAAVGLEVDQQQITVAALATDTITSGAPFLQALRDGSFDFCQIERDRVFFSDKIGGTAIGSVVLFKGQLGTIDELGRTSAKLTVNSLLVLLDIDMPRNVYQPTCLHTLYDSGCTLVKNAFGTNGTVGSGSTASVINWSGASTNFQQGSITFTSGVNASVTATVGSVVAGTSMTLLYPLESLSAPGDGFTVYYGCDHTPGTCQSKFNNLANFRGFPYRVAPLPNECESATAMLAGLSPAGIVLSGGENLAPYGGECPERDFAEYAIYEWAIQSRTPVLGVCRGAQLVAHYHGARLTPIANHVGRHHRLEGRWGGRKVNSFHALAVVEPLPPDLCAEAWADGGLESFAHRNGLVQCVMWHPERCTPWAEGDMELVRQHFGVAE